ncbi:hypothetical protein R1flu_025442 [Riccia fluitans]|uniref:Uncharacterized protein n=1 Tax=Riccia fluitans TaxID=41844 RepID=A0ABD1XY54_9MARC
MSTVAVESTSRNTAAGTRTESPDDILEATKEILRCYDEKIISKESWYRRTLDHIPQITEEDVLALARVGNLSEEFRKKIERLDSVVRLDKRVCELEKENEVLRYERDTQACDLRAVCKEVDTFLDMVESFLDVDSDRQKDPGSDDDLGWRASSSSVSKTPIMVNGKELSATRGCSQSPVSRKMIPGENERRRGPISPGIRPPSPSASPKSSKMAVIIFDKGKRAMSPGIRSPKNGSMTSLRTDKRVRPLSPFNRHASPIPRQASMIIADTRKRKWPDSERQYKSEVVHGRVALPPGILRWKV